jgi:hypothetical protein
MLKCPNPEFPYDELRGCYLACTKCKRLAWDHEQASPVQDIRNEIKWVRQGEKGRPPAPAMKEMTDDSN